MTIIPENYPEIPVRYLVIHDLADMISRAITSPEPVAAYDLAAKILDTVENNIEKVDDDGAVLYRD
jgi:hypothetical protein